MTRRAPAHLRRPTAAFWRLLVADFALEEAHERVLTAACEAIDRAAEARETLATEGTFYSDRWNQPRAHPALAIERAARLDVARLLRDLGLVGEPLRAPRALTAAAFDALDALETSEAGR